MSRTSMLSTPKLAAVKTVQFSPSNLTIPSSGREYSAQRFPFESTNSVVTQSPLMAEFSLLKTVNVSPSNLTNPYLRVPNHLLPS